MKEFDYVILGGGCAGLSLAYELEINNREIKHGRFGKLLHIILMIV